MELTDYEVLIVGGGPVGLTLAIDLGQRGVRCLLVDKRPEPSFLPKMERCHPRTMEHFRRLGIADAVRAAGYPLDLPFDAFLVNTLAEPAIARLPRPSVETARTQARAQNDGRHPAEPSQIISQYALEPLLKSVAERTPGVTVRFGCELLSFEEKPGGVTARVKEAGGERMVSALYLAGCDGGSSTVRAALGFRLEGKPDIGRQAQALFRCDALFERMGKVEGLGKGCHYYRADDRWTFLITQGDTHQFSLHAMVEDENELPAIFEELVAAPIAYETLYLGKWTMRLMLADRYAAGRVFLAGDAVHLVTPIGGLGMNTGIGDAIDLAWKLAARLKGWGGDRLLASYETERRAIGDRNVKAAEHAYWARRVWRDLCAEEVDRINEPDNAAVRAHVGGVWLEQHRKGSGMMGITQGYRYRNSPLIVHEAGDDGADQARYDYVPGTLPGGRIPHVWLRDGSALQDHVRDGFTLVSRQGAGDGGLREAFEARGCPFAALDLGGEPAAREMMERDHLLLRPDLHIAWRGNALPDDPARLAALVTGG
jgi:2-polyprenyl-6-methoxyphenol hydroxylase-like FAD-dependent oxidoreductase